MDQSVISKTMKDHQEACSALYALAREHRDGGRYDLASCYQSVAKLIHQRVMIGIGNASAYLQ